MKLKRTIQIIEYSNIALIVGLFIVVLSIVFRSNDGKFLVFEMLFAFPFILGFFFRKLVVKRKLRNTKYPGIFYSVLDKLGLTHNLEIELTDELLNDMYKSSLPTKEFLDDNNLKTEFDRKKPESPWIMIVSTLVFLALIFFGRNTQTNITPTVAICLFFLIGYNIYSFIKTKRDFDDNIALLKFTSNGLSIKDRFIDWKDIYDWTYQIASRSEPAKFIINHYHGNDRNIQDSVVSLSEVNINKLDFLMLVAHYKARYGQEQHTS